MKYNEGNLNMQMIKADLIVLKEILQNKAKQKQKTPKKHAINSSILIYNRTLQNISDVVSKNWHFLPINSEFCNVFNNKPTMSFKRKKIAHRWPFNKGW